MMRRPPNIPIDNTLAQCIREFFLEHNIETIIESYSTHDYVDFTTEGIFRDSWVKIYKIPETQAINYIEFSWADPNDRYYQHFTSNRLHQPEFLNKLLELFKLAENGREKTLEQTPPSSETSA